MAKVYENTGGTFTEIPAGLTGVYASSVAWGDYDNDGDLDILLTGLPPSGGNPVAKVYENTDGAFSEVPATGLTGVSYSSVAWGDYDNDGDLDILLTAGYDSGGNPVAKVYQNPLRSPTPHRRPRQPRRSLVRKRRHAQLGRGHDAETPAAGLTYNLRVGTTPGGSEITAAMADDASGYRASPPWGMRITTELDPGRPGTAGVLERAGVDAGYAGQPSPRKRRRGPSPNPRPASPGSGPPRWPGGTTTTTATSTSSSPD